MLWHRRETRRQTEKTKLNLHHRERPAYSPDSFRKSDTVPLSLIENRKIAGLTPVLHFLSNLCH
jgi:hypothetical protein